MYTSQFVRQVMRYWLEVEDTDLKLDIEGAVSKLDVDDRAVFRDRAQLFGSLYAVGRAERVRRRLPPSRDPHSVGKRQSTGWPAGSRRSST